MDAEATPENRVCHLSDEFEPSYFAGLVSETYDPRANRFAKRRGARNEPLDTWCTPLPPPTTPSCACTGAPRPSGIAQQNASHPAQENKKNRPSASCGKR